jgi:hypothetical protein
MALKFSAWFPLTPDAIDANAPASTGVYEVRVYGPLLVYPKGRSAMVLYGATDKRTSTLRTTLKGLSETGLPQKVRSAIGTHPVYFRTAASREPKNDLQRRLEDFEMRFGGYPVGNL